MPTAVPLSPGSDTRSLIPGAPIRLFRVRLATGAYILNAGVNARAQYAVAPDGRFLLNAVVDVEASPITIVLNWTAALGE
jgi:hypothetical protein